MHVSSSLSSHNANTHASYGVKKTSKKKHIYNNKYVGKHARRRWYIQSNY